MILARRENKYGFDMQVSAEIMEPQLSNVSAQIAVLS
jgi:hypothetical protein